MAPSQMTGVLLKANGSVKLQTLCPSGVSLSKDILQGIVKKKTPLEELGALEWKGKVLTFFGYTSGKKGTESTHTLPTPLEDIHPFSDTLVIQSKTEDWSDPLPLTLEQYERFYQSACGAVEDDDFDDDDEEEDEEEKEEEEDEEEDLPTSAKKKAAEEDGVPEDEDDKEADETAENEEEEEGDEEEEEEEEDEPYGDEGEGEGEEIEDVPKKRASSKKKAVKTNTVVVQNTGRAKQQLLLQQPGFSEMEHVDAIPTIDGPERSIRQHILTLLQKLLGKQLKQSMYVELEQAICMCAFQEADQKQVIKHFENNLFELLYMAVARRLISNLAPSSYVGNTHLLPLLKNGSLKPSHFTTMTIQEYAPSLYAPLRDKLLLREQHQLEGHKSFATDMFKCFRCMKRETVFYELQTRSADEPMTKFITCVNCGNHWRM
jgi:DNA-directed RNA polymerase subunit M/transcription elongation factor TFIIS